MRFLLVLLLAAACGSSSNSVGSTCSSNDDCGGKLCLKSSDFPSGYCSQGCTLSDPSSCPSGSVCIDDASGTPAGSNAKSVCYQSCSSDGDCTSPMKCREKSSKKVCRSGA